MGERTDWVWPDDLAELAEQIELAEKGPYTLPGGALLGLLAHIEQLHIALDEVTDGHCRVCGCSENAPCEGGCGWAAEDLCTACQHVVRVSDDGDGYEVVDRITGKSFTGPADTDDETEGIEDDEVVVWIKRRDAEEFARELNGRASKPTVDDEPGPAATPVSLFVTPGIRSILRGDKTSVVIPLDQVGAHVRCPLGRVGTQLPVQEGWRLADEQPEDEVVIVYGAGDGRDQRSTSRAFPKAHIMNVETWLEEENRNVQSTPGKVPPWREAATLPPWAVRITITLTSVSLVRLHQLSDQEVLEIGYETSEAMRLAKEPTDGRLRFSAWWDLINRVPRLAYKHNPWVWVVRFTTEVRDA